MVPNGWKQKKLSQLAEVKRGKFSARPRNDPKYYGGDIPFVQTGDVTGANTYLKSHSQTLNEDGLSVSKLFPKGTILITIAANIGDTSIASYDVAFPDSVVGIIANEDTDNVWLKYCLETVKGRLDAEASQNAQKNINLQVLNPLQLLTPPYDEQKKIARILSTWDKAIEKVDKLIENSKQQKKALMQQLLTGKKRLPGFSGDWREVRLKDISEILVSNVDKKSNAKERPVKLCNYTDVYYNDYITNKIEFMQVTAKESEIKKFKLEKGDVIITKDSETPGDIAIPTLVDENIKNFVCGYHLAIIRPHLKLAVGDFLAALFSMPETRYYFFTLANGATRFGLNISSIQNAKFKVPKVEEQRAISVRLRTLNNIIASYLVRRENISSQKQALMQQLLTGKRRVQV
ncbi:restriction endonuclease subunit S [Maridesulfovibrio sp.]|uniref:restriction endonuclease subunit S n=1 Tax=Maridesulfovibrio sp. TaxID=2795000 RepID=UPI0039F0D4F1